MTAIKLPPGSGQEDISRPVSPIADNESLNEELPTYENSLAGTAVPVRPPPEKSPLPPIAPVQSPPQPVQRPIAYTPQQQEQLQRLQRPTEYLRPTTSSPFQFPVDAPPPGYAEEANLRRPLAIPQIKPTPAAPLLSAYPPALLAYGIPPESWRSFLETVSAFISATVSKQALHHATDVASSIGELWPKRFQEPTMRHISRIEENARNLNPFGVIRHTVRLTAMTALRTVGSLGSVHSAIWQKPSTPRERAEVYIATANQDWFAARGLCAVLLDTAELAELTKTDAPHFLKLAQSVRSDNADRQIDTLREFIGELDLFEPRELPEAQPAEAAGSRSPVAPAVTPTLKISEKNLWLVVLEAEANTEYLGKGKAVA